MRQVASVVVAMKPVTLALIAAVVLPVPTSHATSFDFFATLSGPAESPPNNSPGTGTATLSLSSERPEDYRGARRIAPSRRITSPLSMSFSMMCLASLA